MKLNFLIQCIFKGLEGTRAKNLKLLQHQRFLLHQGCVTTAEVIETTLSNDKVGSLLPVRLWLKLKTKDDNFIYTHTIAFISIMDIPARGQVVTIKYLPDNLSCVLILN